MTVVVVALYGYMLIAHIVYECSSFVINDSFCNNYRRFQALPKTKSCLMTTPSDDNSNSDSTTATTGNSAYTFQYKDYENNYNYKPLSPLDQAGGIMYRQSVFTKEEFETICKEVEILTSNKLQQETSSIAQHRLGAALPPTTSQTVQILQHGSLYRLVQRITQDSSMELSLDLPVEVRLYQTVGSGMAWHSDDVLYQPKPQLEIVITLENTSDCVTMWKKKTKTTASTAISTSDIHGGDTEFYSQETDPNSALLLMAGGPLHCVTSLKRGRRLILKCAYASKQSTFSKGIHINQFDTVQNVAATAGSGTTSVTASTTNTIKSLQRKKKHKKRKR